MMLHLPQLWILCKPNQRVHLTPPRCRVDLSLKISNCHGIYMWHLGAEVALGSCLSVSLFSSLVVPSYPSPACGGSTAGGLLLWGGLSQGVRQCWCYGGWFAVVGELLQTCLSGSCTSRVAGFGDPYGWVSCVWSGSGIVTVGVQFLHTEKFMD